mmetsp:Transcript_29194/g.69321  ORF Transcript_29194/g.69321 Transcript_29194/m.69321 type:complete len:530 (+) Transcript_29194:158-1747(+)
MPTSQADMEKLLKDWWISGTKRLHLGSGRLQAYTAGEMQQLCSLIPKAHPDVKGLLMFSNALDDAQAAAVPEALERLPHLKGLSLHGDNKFGGEAAAKIFIAAVRHCLHLDELFMPEHCDPNTVDWAQLGVTMSAQVLAAAKKDGIIWQWAARILTGGGYWDWGPMVKKQREMQAAGLVAPLPTVPDAGGSAAVLEVEKEEQRQLEAALALSKLTFQQQGVAHLSLDSAAPAAVQGVAEPPLAPDPGEGGGKTLAKSAFKAAYSEAKAADDDISLLSVVKVFLQEYCKRKGLGPEKGSQLLTAVRVEANAIAENWFMEGLTDVIGMAQRLWSSTSRGCGDRELCSLLNDALRSDEPALMAPLAVFARTINAGLITRRSLAGPLPWPPNHETYRGAVLPQEHLQWYQRMAGRKYRVPGFLATSFEQETAEEFAQRAWQALSGKVPAVLYTLKLDPRGATRKVRRCQHVSLIRKSNVQTEAEFLYVPYSTFTVAEVRVSGNPTYLDPHIVVLQSSVDNMTEPEDLPLAPWY